eukprot:TRINITY_DN5801_c0_g1_i6.p1 TRINITY_DN5801_c0_g1~~TRINITY_DN5801_c0_g1_i6.p1  ORF type:complete len:504 (+),score=73.23 TRINITY_DN5801_c0_g1_i6:121-1512(+)
MADAKDILGLPKGPLPTQERRPKAPKEAVKKPDGVSREVFALTGGLPMLVPSVDITTAKKRTSDADKISWQWLPFTSSARKDNLQLYHWVKVVNGVPPSGDYAFAKYNKKVDIVRYTDEEYNKYLTDPNWTREETDQLFDLCEQFDLRFIVIADRFTPTRSVEELKNRYYSAARALLLAKAPSPEEVADHPLVKEPYNIIQELGRKKALAAMYTQSKHQDDEDAEVVAEVKVMTEPRVSTKSGEEVEHSVACPTTVASNMENEKASTPVGSTSPSPAPAPRVSITAAASTPTSSSTGLSTPASLRSHGVYLRTTLIGQLLQATVSSTGVRTVKRIDQTLQDLGVNLKPKVPTKAVCTEHLELRKEILTLLNLQKQVKESEILALRDNPYGDFSLTPNTPKLQRSHRGGEHDKTALRGLFGADDIFSGERIGKREHKRKAPARFTETPPSPPQNKRARKKVSDS